VAETELAYKTCKKIKAAASRLPEHGTADVQYATDVLLDKLDWIYDCLASIDAEYGDLVF
jgi:hypothetical protein